MKINRHNQSKNQILVIFALTILLAMLLNVFHPYLWGPDEPRVAEIARETALSGNYVTPHLCQRPFIEKPPLFFDMIALNYALSNRATAGGARIVSALMGLLMLGVALGLGCYWGGLRRGVLATLVLITMPQFYRTTHLIVTDNGVGAFCSLALGLFSYFVCQQEKRPAAKDIKWVIYLFYLVSAAAFLSKGLIGVFHIGVVCGAFIILRKRRDLLKLLLSPDSLLIFFIPVGIWIYFFYREGGIYFLHEHFINNSLGRFLHIQFKLKGSQLAFTDIGRDSSWFFYFRRAPAMFGGATVILGFILYDGLKKLRTTAKKKPGSGSKKDDLVLILLLWAFLPAILLSFSSIKEVTYILPSYVAIAILAGGWLDERLSISKPLNKGLWCFVIIVIPAEIATFFWPAASPDSYIFWLCSGLVIAILPTIISALKKDYLTAILMLSAIILSGLILSNTPAVMRQSRFNRRCYIDMAKYVFNKTGNHTLYLYGGCETLRGSMPFYGKRKVTALANQNELEKVLGSDQESFVIMTQEQLNYLQKNNRLSRMLNHCKINLLPYPKLNCSYILVQPQNPPPS